MNESAVEKLQAYQREHAVPSLTPGQFPPDHYEFGTDDGADNDVEADDECEHGIPFDHDCAECYELEGDEDDVPPGPTVHPVCPGCGERHPE